ncbi:MAG: hypothetical protein WKF40_04375 [Thermoleophilaceae bacterium]
MLKERTTYEIMDATTIGLEQNSIVLGKHSGRHALRNALRGAGLRGRGRCAEHRLQGASRSWRIARRPSRRWTWRRSSPTRCATPPRRSSSRRSTSRRARRGRRSPR